MMLDLQKVKIVSVYQKVPKYHAYCYKLKSLLYFQDFFPRKIFLVFT